jgi:5-(carboxyamino)imidazole ribonucleotide mutase
MKLALIVGSESDLKFVADKAVNEIITRMRGSGIDVEVSVISAHRNADVLVAYCSGEANDEKAAPRAEPTGDGITSIYPKLAAADLFVCAAGMAAALPGSVAAATKFLKPVFAVPLPSSGFESCMDAFLAEFRMPPGVPVAVVNGLYNALLTIWSVLSLRNENQAGVSAGFKTFVEAKTKKPRLNLSDAEIETLTAPKKP